MTFGAAAARLAGACVVAFGWPPERFWRATPAEVAGVVAALAPVDAAPVTRADLEKLETSCG